MMWPLPFPRRLGTARQPGYRWECREEAKTCSPGERELDRAVLVRRTLPSYASTNNPSESLHFYLSVDLPMRRIRAVCIQLGIPQLPSGATCVCLLWKYLCSRSFLLYVSLGTAAAYECFGRGVACVGCTVLLWTWRRSSLERGESGKAKAERNVERQGKICERKNRNNAF